MKVSELITLLQEENPDSEVMILSTYVNLAYPEVVVTRGANWVASNDDNVQYELMSGADESVASGIELNDIVFIAFDPADESDSGEPFYIIKDTLNESSDDFGDDFGEESE